MRPGTRGPRSRSTRRPCSLLPRAPRILTPRPLWEQLGMPLLVAASLDLAQVVQRQPLHGGSTDRSQTLDPQPVPRPAEVARPPVPPRVKERDDSLRARVLVGLEVLLVELASVATQGEVARIRRAALAFWFDVIQSEAMREQGLRRPAVLAAEARPRSDLRVPLADVELPRGHSTAVPQ